MMSSSEDSGNARTLYVGNLDPSVSEDLLMALFSQIGPCKNCKIIHEPTGDPYAFIEFGEHQAAANALLAMNKRQFLGKEIKVNWATTSAGTTNKIDTSKHFHIFVGDLAPEIDQNALHEAFAPFGEISEIKMVKFNDTQKSKGYCFISFLNQSDAEAAITSMNGQWLGGKRIRTNWAARKSSTTNDTPTNSRIRDSNPYHNGKITSAPRLEFNEVWNRTSDTNTTVYFGNCGEISEELVRSLFQTFGTISDLRIFKEKGYAFIRYPSKDNACYAICHMHGFDVNGHTAKCGWGRDESTNNLNNTQNYSNNTNNHNYNTNPYETHSQNLHGPSLNNMYMGGQMNPNAYGNYLVNYPQQQQQQPQQQQQQQQQQPYNSQPQWNHNGPQSWNNYSQPMSGGWNNINNYGQNSNQYYGQQQPHMYSSNSNWGPSTR